MSVSPRPTRPRSVAPRLALLALVAIALLIRWQFRDVVSGDYRTFLLPWYEHLAQRGGFPGLADDFANYDTPYLALLAALTYLPVPPLYGIKAISVLFDLVMAFFAHRIIRQVRPSSTWAPVLVVGVVLLLPTTVLNGAAWAQCDGIYVALCLAALSFTLERRPWVGTFLFGIAFAFKLQAIFLVPALVLLVVANRQRLRALVAAPVAFLAMLAPALVAGRSLLSQLAIYPGQITGSSGGAGSRGGGVGPGQAFTYNAPTFYAWLPAGASSLWTYAGLAVAGLVAATFAVWLLRRPRPFTTTQGLLVAAVSVLVVPMLLPQMHERYFYLAEVLLVIAAFAEPWLAVPALAIQTASTLTYVGYLSGTNVLPLALTAVIGLVATVSAELVLVLGFERHAHVPEAGPLDATAIPPVRISPTGGLPAAPAARSRSRADARDRGSGDPGEFPSRQAVGGSGGGPEKRAQLQPEVEPQPSQM